MELPDDYSSEFKHYRRLKSPTEYPDDHQVIFGRIDHYTNRYPVGSVGSPSSGIATFGPLPSQSYLWLTRKKRAGKY